MNADNAAVVAGAPAQPVAAAPAIGEPPAAPGAAGATQNVPAPARRDKKPRKQGRSISTATISGIAPLYSLVATHPFHTNTDHTNSTYIPSFIAMCVVIQEMNFSMAYTHRFLQGAPAWQPFITILYVGILFYVQTFRAMREIGVLDSDQAWFLDCFERDYDLRSLLVPGPLVPYFQALAAAAGPFENIGDFGPSIPTTLGSTATRAYNLDNSLHRVLPNIPLYIDACLRSLPSPPSSATTNLDIESNFAAVVQHFWSDTIHGSNVSPLGSTRFCIESPGAYITPHFTYAQYRSSHSVAHHYGFPPALDVASYGDIAHWPVFLRFFNNDRTYHPWFQNVSAVMQRYCQFMRESVPLSAIPAAGLGSGIVIWKYASIPELNVPWTYHAAVAAGTFPTWNRYFQTHRLHSLTADGTHPDRDLEEIAEQNSAIAQINVDLTNNCTRMPINMQLRAGPIWTLPVVRTAQGVNYARGISAVIASHYHDDSRHI